MIENIVDDRLENRYNVSSIWKLAEIAMECVQYEGAKRPSMYAICNELVEAIKLERVYSSPQISNTEESSILSSTW